MRKLLYTLLLCATVFTSIAQVGILLKDINPNGSSSPHGYKALNSTTVVFGAFDGNFNGLWKTDGTAAGTQLVKAASSTFSMDLNNTVVLNGKLYFFGEDNTNGAGWELFESDGTTAGTHLFKDLHPGPDPTYGGDIFLTNGKFAFKDDQHIWLSDGTANGTVMAGGTIEGLIMAKAGGDYIYYWKMIDITNTHEIWRMNVNTGATQMITGDFDPYLPNSFAFYNDDMYVLLTEYDTSGISFSAVKKIMPNGTVQHFSGSVDNNGISGLPQLDYNNKLYFGGGTPVTGAEVYSSNGVPGNFVLEAEVIPGNYGSAPSGFVGMGGDVYFNVLSDIPGIVNYSVYKVSAGVASKIVAGNASAYTWILAQAQDKLFVTAQSGNEYYLYSVSSNSSTAQLVFLDQFSSSNGSIGFTCNNKVFMAGFVGKDSNNEEPFVIDPNATETSIVWTGNISTSWGNKNNWLPKQVPADTNNVIIPGGKPRYPIIASGMAQCKNFNVSPGGSLSMTGGTINIYGTFDYDNANCLSFTGGTVKLYGGNTLKLQDNTAFYNLTLTSVNNAPDKNIYRISEAITINGNLVMQGTATGNDPKYPFLLMQEGTILAINKNLTLSQGKIGTEEYLLPMADNHNIPEVWLSGGQTAAQQLRFSNKIAEFEDRSGIMADLVVGTTNVKLVNMNTHVQVLNLKLLADFDLRGNKFTTGGKIIYGNVGFSNIIKNTGSFTPSHLWIQNDGRYASDTEKAILRCGRLCYYVSFTPTLGFTQANDTLVLESDLTTYILEWDGYLDMNGKNVTVGSASSNMGYLYGAYLGTDIASGTLKLLGNSLCPQYGLRAHRINNITVNNPAGVKIRNYNGDPFANNTMELMGTIRLTNGRMDINSATVRIINQPNLPAANTARLVEPAGYTVFDNTGGQLYADTVVTTAVSNLNTGSLGFYITTPETWLNNITVIRYSGNNLTDGIAGPNLVGRIFQVNNNNTGGNLNARIKIKYDETELNGINESSLRIYRFNYNLTNPVQLLPSAVNVTSNIVSTTTDLYELDLYNDNQATFYVLASVNVPPMRIAAAMEPVVETIDVNVVNDVKAYPNPFNNSFSATLTSTTKENAIILVTDISGRMVHISSVLLTEGENTLNVCCMENAPDGIYFMQVKSLTKNNVIRIVKNR